MPELPEVETVRRGLLRALPGERIDALELRRRDLRWPLPIAALRRQVGARFTTIERRSKYLLLGLDSGARLLVHLGMSGRLFLTALDGDAPPAPELHEHWRIALRGRLLRYVDPRRFGMLDVLPDAAASHPLLDKLGPEPLGDEFTGEYLFAATRGRKVAIKLLLMDAHQVVGVGNIYASEALFRAGIRPTRAAGRLRRAECDALAEAVQHTLRQAIEAGGTTIRDYIGVDESSGYFQQQLAVYGRDGEPCRACGAPIVHLVQGARATYYCRSCQR